MSWFFWRWSQHQTWMASSPPTKTSKLSHLHCRAAGPWHGRVEQNLTTDLLPQFNKSNVSSEDRNNCAKLDSTQREGPTRNEDLWLTKLLLLLTYSAASLHSAPIFCDKIKDKSPCISLVIYCLVYCSLTSHYSPYLGYWWMILEGMSSEQGEETLHFIHHLQTKSILVNIENTLDHSQNYAQLGPKLYAILGPDHHHHHYRWKKFTVPHENFGYHERDLRVSVQSEPIQL